MASAYAGPERRHEDAALSWDQIENRMRRIIREEVDAIRVDILERSVEPLKDRVDMQERFCSAHAQELTEVHTLLNEVVEAKVIRRIEVAEARISLIGKSTVVIGTIAGTAICGLIVAILTHQIPT